jgi:hypothetical protein
MAIHSLHLKSRSTFTNPKIGSRHSANGNLLGVDSPGTCR